MAMKGIVSKTVRHVKITTPKVIPLATEEIEKEKSILRNKTGEFIEVAPHHLTKNIRKFLEQSDISFETSPVIARRGKVEIAGIRVKVYPIKHTHYDGGVIIRIEEASGTSYENTNKVLKYLINQGINVATECTFLEERTEEGACLFKME